MTAQEYFKEEMIGEPLTQDWVVEHLITFAQHHIAEALKEASNNVNMVCEWDLNQDDYRDRYKPEYSDGVYESAGSQFGDRDRTWVVNKESILNSYPLTNIK